jgi:hypothetical protein
MGGRGFSSYLGRALPCFRLLSKSNTLSSYNFGELRAFDGGVGHQSLLTKDDGDDGFLDLRRINGDPCTDINRRDAS